MTFVGKHFPRPFEVGDTGHFVNASRWFPSARRRVLGCDYELGASADRTCLIDDGSHAHETGGYLAVSVV